MTKLRALQINRYLKNKNIDFYVQSVRCSSTNNYAKCSPLNRDGVYITNKQKQGKGRGEKKFLSLRGGLYMSVVLFRDVSLLKLYHFPLIAALATVRALGNQNIKAGIKWPNDIMVGGKKLGGILCESKSSSNNIIIGIGINLTNDINSVKDVAISAKDLGVKVCYHKLVGDCISYILAYESMELSEFLSEYRHECISIGKQITITETGDTGIARDIDNDGFLLADVAGEIVRIVNPAH